MYAVTVLIYLIFPWFFASASDGSPGFDVVTQVVLLVNGGLFAATWIPGFGAHAHATNRALCTLVALHLLLIVWQSEAATSSVVGVMLFVGGITAALPYNFRRVGPMLAFFGAMLLGVLIIASALPGGANPGVQALVVGLLAAAATLAFGASVSHRIADSAPLGGVGPAARLDDTITSLPRRSTFTQGLSEVLAAPRSEPIALMLVDLDRFGRLNAGLGQAIADRVLAAAAFAIQGCVRPGDVVARVGGDEFAVTLSGGGSGDVARSVAERIQSVLSAGLRVGDRTVHCSASIGVAVEGPECPGSELMSTAHGALLSAKQDGPSGLVIVALGAAVATGEEARLEQDLWRALENDELVVHYQPIVGAQEQRIRGVEALVRWNHPRLGLLFPGRFIDLAEASGLIIEVERRVLELACEAVATLRSMLPSSWVAVNVSARRLALPGFDDEILDTLRRHGLPGDALRLEAVEALLIGGASQASAVFNRLREHGVQVEIDDFGTGHSSLARLHELPADGLKIDRSFIVRGAEDTRVLEAICALARSIGAEIVAEGVETAEQLQMVRALGCDLVQGWYFARAMPVDALQLIVQLSDDGTLCPGDADRVRLAALAAPVAQA